MTTVLPLGAYHPAELQRVAWRREGVKPEPLDLKPVQEMPGLASSISAPQGPQSSFGQILGDLVNEVNTKQGAAGEAVQQLLTGGNVSLHQTMIAMEEANVSFQLMVEIRNKLIESYQELMRMQI